MYRKCDLRLPVFEMKEKKKREPFYAYIRRVRAIFGPFFRPSRNEPTAEYKVGYTILTHTC